MLVPSVCVFYLSLNTYLVLNHKLKERLGMKLSVDEVMKRLLELDLNFVCVFGLYTNFDLLCVCMYAFLFCPLLGMN